MREPPNPISSKHHAHQTCESLVFFSASKMFAEDPVHLIKLQCLIPSINKKPLHLAAELLPGSHLSHLQASS